MSDSAVEADRIRSDLDSYLETLVPAGDSALFRACRYALSSGGKRVRPILVALAAGAMGRGFSDVRTLAAACEVFHNFTLVHDDIMDRSATRRGQPTVHSKWDEATAVLAGDYLLALSYELVDGFEGANADKIRKSFGGMAKRLCEGQALDMEMEQSLNVSESDYLKMIDGKTGALLSCCLEIGVLAGGADESQASVARGVGIDIGRAFQIQDDLLDATATESRWGKVRGQDLIEGKRSWIVVDVLSAGAETNRTYFTSALRSGGIAPADVDEAIARMRSAGVFERAAEAVVRYTNRAQSGIVQLPESEARSRLSAVVESLGNRSH